LLTKVVTRGVCQGIYLLLHGAVHKNYVWKEVLLHKSSTKCLKGVFIRWGINLFMCFIKLLIPHPFRLSWPILT